ncbi:nuclear transport factor 2 domain-containing [Lecanosticta acicola]|uniref:Nuclear transport factor 2 domain-containing n=1 Tax=Lecanosticta acicola TaxID=111012 RepID=A0AAI8Z8T0_9PEZI|nr:nuclear transport factor 2 domain-containing [Lecanosticta acicola]
MPVTLTDVDKTRIASETAESFTEAYYNALCASRHTISSFYSPPSTETNTTPYINYNGEVLATGNDFQTEFDKMPYTYFEVQCLNAQILNPCVDPDATGTRKEAERNVSVVVQASGYVRLVERKEGPMRGFADQMILVPGKTGDKGKVLGEGRQWVIQSQTFRFVV